MKLCDLNPGPGIGASAWHVEMDGHGLLMDAGTHPKLEGSPALPLYDTIRERPVDAIAFTHCHQVKPLGVPQSWHGFSSVILWRPSPSAFAVRPRR